MTGMSKAQKKNSKRKEKRRDDGEVESEDEEGTKAAEVADDWDSDGSDDKPTKPAPKKVEPTPPPPPPPVVEPSKRVKALQKKLRQAELLKERETLGLYLPPAEREKIKTIASLEEEIARMTLGDEAPSATGDEPKVEAE